MKKKMLILSALSVCVFAAGVYKVVGLRRFDPSHLNLPKNSVDAAAVEYAHAKANLPPGVSSGTMIDLPEGSEFRSSKTSSDGTVTATLFQTPALGNPRARVSFIQFDYWKDKKHAILSENDNPDIKNCYSLDWISADEIAICSRTNDLPKGSFDFSLLTSSLFKLNSETFASKPILKNMKGLPAITGHDDSGVFLVNNENGATWSFSVVSLNKGETVKTHSWTPWAPSSGDPILGKTMGLKLEEFKQRPGSSEVSILAHDVAPEAVSKLYVFDMSSMKFRDTRTDVQSFFQQNRVNSFAWDTIGDTLSCAVRGRGIFVLNGEDAKMLVREPAEVQIQSFSNSRLVYVGLRDVGNVTNGELHDKLVFTLKRPFYVSL